MEYYDLNISLAVPYPSSGVVALWFVFGVIVMTIRMTQELIDRRSSLLRRRSFLDMLRIGAVLALLWPITAYGIYRAAIR